MNVSERLQKEGQRKLLALDGGGIRGMMSIEILSTVEQILREQDRAGAGAGDVVEVVGQ